MNSFRYEDRQWPKTDAKEYIFSLIRPESYILDLGCWTGRLGEKLRLEKKCEIVGVDINQEALSLAKKRLNYVFQLDLDQPEFLKKVLKEKFDYIVLADVLEHLKDPKSLLELTKNFLKDNGFLLVSIPNVANWTVRWSLLLGKFDYGETGILDKTHLRFYTRKSGRELIESAGYTIFGSYFTGTNFFPTLKAVQFIFVCKK